MKSRKRESFSQNPWHPHKEHCGSETVSIESMNENKLHLDRVRSRILIQKKIEKFTQ